MVVMLRLPATAYRQLPLQALILRQTGCVRVTRNDALLGSLAVLLVLKQASTFPLSPKGHDSFNSQHIEISCAILWVTGCPAGTAASTWRCKS